MVNTPFVEISPTVVLKEEVVYYGHLSDVRSAICIRRHSSTVIFACLFTYLCRDFRQYSGTQRKRYFPKVTT